MKNIEQKIINFIAQYKLIEKNERILISLSGGTDSVLALHFFYKYKKKYKIDIAAIHFNHQLRGEESDEDEKFCNEICKNLNVPFYSFRLNVYEYAKKNKQSLEEAARELRYKSLDDFTKKYKFDKIITAHNLTDNTETILLNLFSGTGLSGFSGIPIKRKNIIRPLLCLTKIEILNYLHKYNLNYRIDSSNLKNDFKRNIIRNEILPIIREKLNPQIDSAIFRSSKIIENLNTFIESYINKLIDKYIRISKNGIFIKFEIKKIDDVVFGEILKNTLLRNLNYQIEYKDSIKLKSLFDKQPGKEIRLTKNIKAIKERNGIKIFSDAINKEALVKFNIGEKIEFNGHTIKIEEVDKKNVKMNKSKNIEYISGDNLVDTFLIRKWKPGDRFIPLGMKKPKKVSDFLTDEKVKSSEKKDKLLLLNKNLIVWVIGHRIDDRVKITKKTKRILKLWIK